MSEIGMAASHLQVEILEASSASSLQEAVDAWLDAHIATEVVSMEFGTYSALGFEHYRLLIVYKGERRVRRS